MKRLARHDLAAAIQAAANGRDRIVVAIAGAPGSGKSTLAETLATALPDAKVLPMDGFHLDNATLDARGLRHRKGAPETFDVAGFAALLDDVAQGRETRIPMFDRAEDRVVPDGPAMTVETRIVLVEGNYLLLDQPGWRDLQNFWDMSVLLDVPEDVLEQRLISRWLHHGLSREEATERARGNDLANARIVRERSLTPSVLIRD